MPVYCAVLNCKSKYNERNKAVRFHRFPKRNKLILREWVKFSGQSEEIITKSRGICSLHFKKSDYKRDLRNELLGLPTKVLLHEGTIPSIYTDDDSPANSEDPVRNGSITLVDTICHKQTPKMKCIVCDRVLNSIDEDVEGEDEDDDLDLTSHRKLLLSIFCKYFNWENNYNLTPSQLLASIPSSSSSSSSAASNFPFCTKCEDKMNELNDWHNNLEKIQLNISKLISSMSMEIIKVFESSSAPESKSESPMTTTTKIVQSKPQDPLLVPECVKTSYQQLKPQVTVEEPKKKEKHKRKTTTTTGTYGESIIKKSRVEPEREETETVATNVVNMTVAPNVSSYLNLNDEEEIDMSTISIKIDPLDPLSSSAYSPDNHEDATSSHFNDDSGSTFDHESSYNYIDTSQVQEMEEEEDCKPHIDEPGIKEIKISSVHFAKETEPGSNIFRYYDWEFEQLSENSFKCLACSVVRAIERHNIMRHINTVHVKARSNCGTCGLSWASQELKDQHICKGQEIVQIGQEFCYKGKYLKLNEGSDDQEDFICLVENCHQRKREEKDMISHIRECHEGVNKNYLCDICQELLPSASLLEGHKACHLDPAIKICDLCGKTFKSPGALYNHRLTHLGPYPCEFEGCNRKFSSPKHLQRHRIDANHLVSKNS